MKPALTKEEWAFLESGKVFIAVGTREVNILIDGGTCAVPIADPHATAALCLHNQEFGFTREMVEALGEALSSSECDVDVGCLANEAVVRIAALLPPEDGPVVITNSPYEYHT